MLYALNNQRFLIYLYLSKTTIINTLIILFNIEGLLYLQVNEKEKI
jgi:hypothetical protein